MLAVCVVLTGGCSKQFENRVEPLRDPATIEAERQLRAAANQDLPTSKYADDPGDESVAITAGAAYVSGDEEDVPGMRVSAKRLLRWLDAERGEIGRRTRRKYRHYMRERIATPALDDQFYFGKPRTGAAAPVHRAVGPHADVPALFADNNLAATRVAEIVAAMCHHGAGLALGGGMPTKVHKVWLGTYEGVDCKGDPMLRRTAADGMLPTGLAVRVASAGYRVYDGKSESSVSRTAGELVRAFPKPLWNYRLFVSVTAGAKVSDLIALLDELVEIGVTNVHLGRDWDKAKAAVRERFPARPVGRKKGK